MTENKPLELSFTGGWEFEELFKKKTIRKFELSKDEIKKSGLDKKGVYLWLYPYKKENDLKNYYRIIYVGETATNFWKRLNEEFGHFKNDDGYTVYNLDDYEEPYCFLKQLENNFTNDLSGKITEGGKPSDYRETYYKKLRIVICDLGENEQYLIDSKLIESSIQLQLLYSFGINPTNKIHKTTTPFGKVECKQTCYRISKISFPFNTNFDFFLEELTSNDYIQDNRSILFKKIMPLPFPLEYNKDFQNFLNQVP